MGNGSTMEFDIKNVHTQATKYLVTKAIARVLHECPGHFLAYPERLPNFEVRLNYQKNIETRNNGTGTFTVTKPIGEKFCRLYRRGEIAVEVNGRTIKFYPTNRSVEQGLALKLERARFIDPDIEQERQKKFDTLRDAFLVSNVQIG
ncbi:hypothetical protein ID866_6656 [Astraeus odoratus]|nr:hypothetical protein ID866_6656 [Astraeus odoratus]